MISQLDFTKKNVAFQLFQEWFEIAKSTEINDPEAMALATVDDSGRVSARMVLLKNWWGKEFADAGFVFFTNADSDKGKALTKNPLLLSAETKPYAALLFYWKTIRKQVRIEGRVEKLDNQLSDEYFQTRPRGSQLGAHASLQSRPMQTRDELQKRFLAMERQFQNQEVPRPKHWHGFCLKPDRIEFWENGENRLHARLLFVKDDNNILGYQYHWLFP